MKVEDLKKLPLLNIPYGDLKLAEDKDGNLRVLDFLRKKYVMLTPEEFVRQNFISWMTNSLGYPVSYIANEVEIRVNDTKKRCDTVIFSSDLQPLMIIEYKAPGIEITQDTFNQIVRYNMQLKAKYLVVSNGIRNYCCKIDYERETYDFIRVIPTYRDAIGMPGIN